MPKIYLFLILSLLLVKLNAQKTVVEDYIITTNGEQIFGEVKLQSLRENQQGCTFKAKGQNNYQSYTPTQLRAFYTRKIYFASKILPDSTQVEQVFLECYFKGKYSLYGKGNKHYIENDTEPIRPISINGGVVSKDGVLVKRADGEFLGLLRRFSSECAGLGLQIQANVQSYDLKSFLDLLEDYHKCLKLPYQRYGIPRESYRLQWEAGAALGRTQMSLKPSFVGLSYVDLILHQGTGGAVNAAFILKPQRYIFFPSLVIAPEWAYYAYSQNDARYIDDLTRKSTYIESSYRASFLAVPIYLRQPAVQMGNMYLSCELGLRIESTPNFSEVQYLIEREGLANRQYFYVESQLFDHFNEQVRGLSTGLLTGVRLSWGDQNDATGAFAIGFRYSRMQKGDPGTSELDQPLLFRNNLYNIYLSKRF